MHAVLESFLQAIVAEEWDTAYELLHPDLRSQEASEEFRDRHRRASDGCGDFVGFKIDEIVFSTWFALVVDVPANRPRERRGSRPSVVRGVARWIQEDGQWRIFTPPWEYWFKRDKPLPIALRALDGDAGSVWSPKKDAVPECPDMEGLHTALRRLIEALVASDNAAIHQMFASQTKAQTSFVEFDDELKRLQEEWLKPVRLYSISRPELQALATLRLKPADWIRESLKKGGLQPESDDVWPLWCRPGARLHDGRWYIWWPT